MPGRGRGRRERSRAEAPRRRSRRGGEARSERRAREREAQRPARETVEELLREELGFGGFRPTIEEEAREAAKWAERESGPRRDLTALATFTVDRLMILNNEQVAQLLERERVPAIYRVHAQPDAARIERLLEQLAALGVPTPPLRQGLAPREAGQVAAEASRLALQEARRRGHGRDAYTSLVLRSLKQAYYSERNVGHAGLGSPAYCHFTSPIRRYPDLVCHRALLALLGEGEEAPTLAQARDAAADSSARERESAQIERHADDVCAAYLLERELGERGLDAVFEGEVSGVIRSAAFVSFRGELGDVYEGMLPARRLPGEYFQLDKAEVALVGRESGARVRLGDPISVRVAGVDAPRGRAELDLAGEAAEEPG